MTDQAKDLIEAAHNLLGKTNTGDFDNIAQADAVIKAMRLLSSVLEDCDQGHIRAGIEVEE